MNITFFLGAGASYNACPILEHQGKKMIRLATLYLPKEKADFTKGKPKDLNDYEDILWDIGCFGNKALEYGTIDIYAKKLDLNGSSPELHRLKQAVSVFLTVWQLTSDEGLKGFYHDSEKPHVSDPNRQYDFIDKRYMELMASALVRADNGHIKLRSNIRFVTWNYDLQLESAYKSFCPDDQSWDDISETLNFRLKESGNEDLEICHLNGYHGFYSIPNSDRPQNEHHIMDRTDQTSVHEILEAIGFVSTSSKRGTLHFDNHINYAWEQNQQAQEIRKRAIEIFRQTNFLIIIGYSFPNFNKEIDQQLFSALDNRETRVIYQDPNASKLNISQLVDIEDKLIELEKKNMKNFLLPYGF
ncbi:MAG: hypothetical protein COA57_02110 [Flavobacteriales bacterium]|nr:MAG: hypothetical protein COA57_02110 [Flavobacteriales bacterium]